MSECKTGNGIGGSETELPGFGGFPVDETEPIKDTYTLQLCLYIVQTNYPKANGASFKTPNFGCPHWLQMNYYA